MAFSDIPPPWGNLDSTFEPPPQIVGRARPARQGAALGHRRRQDCPRHLAGGCCDSNELLPAPWAAPAGAACGPILAGLRPRETPMDDAAPISQADHVALLQSGLDHINQGITVTDGNLRLVGWNRRFFSLLEFPED